MVKEKTKKTNKESYFTQVKKEMKKVKWPDAKSMSKYTVITVVFIIFFATFFFALDFIIAYVKSLGV